MTINYILLLTMTMNSKSRYTGLGMQICEMLGVWCCYVVMQRGEVSVVSGVTDWAICAPYHLCGLGGATDPIIPS